MQLDMKELFDLVEYTLMALNTYPDEALHSTQEQSAIRARAKRRLRRLKKELVTGRVEIK